MHTISVARTPGRGTAVSGKGLAISKNAAEFRPGRLIVVNSLYFAYSVRGTGVRIVSKSNAKSALWEGDESTLADICFAGETSHVLLIATQKGSLYSVTLTASQDGNIEQNPKTVSTSTHPLSRIALSMDGSFVAAGYVSGLVSIYKHSSSGDYAFFRETNACSAYGSIRDLSFSRVNDRLSVGTASGRVFVLTAPSLDVVSSASPFSNTALNNQNQSGNQSGIQLSTARFTSDPQYLLCGNEFNTVLVLLHWQSGRVSSTLSIQLREDAPAPGPYYCVEIDSSGKFLLLGSLSDNAILVAALTHSSLDTGMTVLTFQEPMEFATEQPVVSLTAVSKAAPDTPGLYRIGIFLVMLKAVQLLSISMKGEAGTPSPSPTNAGHVQQASMASVSATPSPSAHVIGLPSFGTSSTGPASSSSLPSPGQPAVAQQQPQTQSQPHHAALSSPPPITSLPMPPPFMHPHGHPHPIHAAHGHPAHGMPGFMMAPAFPQPPHVPSHALTADDIAIIVDRCVSSKLSQLETNLETRFESLASRLEERRADEVESMQRQALDTLKSSFKTSFAEYLLPSMESIVKNMLGQISNALREGLTTEMSKFRLAAVEELRKAQQEVIAAGREQQALHAQQAQAAVQAQLTPKQRIQQSVDAEDFTTAFQLALSLSHEKGDVKMLVWLCSQVDPDVILSSESGCKLSQSIIVSLVQQLAYDLREDVAIKLQWLFSAVSAIDETNARAMAKIRPVLVQVQERLRAVEQNVREMGAKSFTSYKVLMKVLTSMTVANE